MIEIDYPSRRLRLFDAKSYVTPMGFSSVPLRLRDGIPTVQATLSFPAPFGKTVKATLAIDTGSAFGVDVTNRLVRHERLDEASEGLPDVMAPAGLGGVATTRAIDALTVAIGDERLRGSGRLVLTDKGKNGRKADYDAVLGGAALQGCDLVFDYSRSTMLLRSSV